WWKDRPEQAPHGERSRTPYSPSDPCRKRPVCPGGLPREKGPYPFFGSDSRKRGTAPFRNSWVLRACRLGGTAGPVSVFRSAAGDDRSIGLPGHVRLVGWSVMTGQRSGHHFSGPDCDVPLCADESCPRGFSPSLRSRWSTPTTPNG